MLSPRLHITQNRPLDGRFWLTDATTGYGEGGNPQRANITRAALRVRQWTPTGEQTVLSADLPLEAFLAGRPASVALTLADGLYAFELTLWSRHGVPLELASYRFSYPNGFPTGARLLLEKNGVWTLADPQPPAGSVGWSLENVADRYSRWRLESLATDAILDQGAIDRYDAYQSALLVEGQVRPQPTAVAVAAQTLLLTDGLRRQLHRLAPVMLVARRAGLPEIAAWLDAHAAYATLRLPGADGLGPATVYHEIKALSDKLGKLCRQVA